MDSRQLDDGVTTVHDVSQIHHSPAHSDAAIQALIDTGRRAAFGYFESAAKGWRWHSGECRIRRTRIASQPVVRASNQSLKNGLVHMIMGGEVYLGDANDREILEEWACNSASRLRRISSRHSASPRRWTGSPATRHRRYQGRGR